MRSIVTATIATMGLESFNAETGSSFSLLSMVPVECDESEPTPNCIVRGTIGDGVESLDCNFSLFSEDDVAYIGTECDDGEGTNSLLNLTPGFSRKFSVTEKIFWHL